MNIDGSIITYNSTSSNNIQSNKSNSLLESDPVYESGSSMDALTVHAIKNKDNFKLFRDFSTEQPLY